MLVNHGSAATTQPSKEKLVLLKRIVRNSATAIEIANVPDNLKDRFTVDAMKKSIFSLLNALEVKPVPPTFYPFGIAPDPTQKKKKEPSIIVIDHSKIFTLQIPTASPPVIVHKKKKKKKRMQTWFENAPPQHIVLKQDREKPTFETSEEQQLIEVLKKAITISAIAGANTLTMHVDVNALKEVLLSCKEKDHNKTKSEI